MSDSAREIIVEPQALHRFMVDLMVAGGASEKAATVAADVHLDADLRGVGPQGFDYLPYTLKSLERGIIDGHAEPEVVRDDGATVLIDGRRGMGQPAGVLAADLAIAKARDLGSATVAIRNATDIYMIGYYAERMARAGVIGMVMTSGPPLVHPHGGMQKLLSTNPIAFGIPRVAEDPLVFDMATSAVASSRVRQAAYSGTPLPPGSGLGPDGRPTTDARAIQAGAISPLGGHKGFGLGLVVALLCGPLTGSGVGLELAGWQAEGETRTQGHLFWATDPAAFVDAAEFRQRTEDYLDLLRNSPRAPGFDAIRMPGERAAATRRRQRESGVAVLAKSWDNVRPYAERFGVTPPAAFR